MDRSAIAAVSLLGIASLAAAGSFVASLPARSAAAPLEPTPVEVQALPVQASLAVIGAPANPSAPPASVIVTVGGVSRTLPLIGSVPGPPWPNHCYVAVYSTPLSERERWRIHVQPNAPNTMLFGIYDGSWHAWLSAPFGDYSDTNVSIDFQ